MKKIIVFFFSLFGLSIKRKIYLYDAKKNLNKTIKHFKIKSILDIGGNTGQFAENVLESGFNGKIVSFEPLSKEHQIIKKKIEKRKNKNWFLEERCALGQKEKKQRIFISGNSESSSLLKILKKHVEMRPLSKIVSSEIVKVKKLDSFYTDIKKKLNNKILLKIDTQGNELSILKGSKKILKIINFALVEVSLVRLYKNQKLYMDIIKFFKLNNFDVWSIDRVMGNHITGQTYQLDIFFYKRKK